MAATRDENNDATPTPTRLSTLNRRCLHELKGAQYYSFTSFEVELSRLMMYLFFALPRHPARGTVPLREKVYSDIKEYIHIKGRLFPESSTPLVLLYFTWQYRVRCSLLFGSRHISWTENSTKTSVHLSHALCNVSLVRCLCRTGLHLEVGAMTSIQSV